MSMNRDWFAGDTYPGFGYTTEQAAQATNTGNMSLQGNTSAQPEATAVGGEGDAIARAGAVGKKANPIVTFFVMVALILVTMWGAEKLAGDEGKYSNIRVSAYNILFIGWIAAIGLFFGRSFFTKFPLPGVTTVFHVA